MSLSEETSKAESLIGSPAEGAGGGATCAWAGRPRKRQDAPSAKARPSVRRAAGGEERSGEAGGVASRPTRTAMGEGKEVLFMALLSEC